MKSDKHFDHIQTSGFNIIEVSDEVWVLQVIDRENFIGTFKEIILVANIRHSISLQEIDIAIQSMSKQGHNAAHFGMWGTFIFSFNKEFEKERKAS